MNEVSKPAKIVVKQSAEPSEDSEEGEADDPYMKTDHEIVQQEDRDMEKDEEAEAESKDPYMKEEANEEDKQSSGFSDITDPAKDKNADDEEDKSKKDDEEKNKEDDEDNGEKAENKKESEFDSKPLK